MPWFLYTRGEIQCPFLPKKPPGVTRIRWVILMGRTSLKVQVQFEVASSVLTCAVEQGGAPRVVSVDQSRDRRADLGTGVTWDGLSGP